MNRYRKGTLTLEIILYAVAIVYLIPVYVLVVSAFKRPDDPTPQLVPTTHPTLANFTEAWTSANLGRAAISSIVVTVASVGLLVVTASLAAYPLARVTARWSRLAYATFVFGLLLPFQLALIPLYVTMRNLGLVGGVWSLVLLYAGVQMPLCIFLYTEFLRSVPRDYDEAAALDGANRLQAFWHVILPMVRPITGTVVILNAVAIWNDFYTPLLFLTGSGNATLPLAVYTFVSTYGAQWHLIFASLIMTSVPILIAFLAMQKAVFRGYSSGLKG
ncbi:carbohydrate ABC transporter permease [Phytohabitans sp. ZYX-F-186]|uniref:Carbohydrate ABC transporter permease n=1 Tax=Phytohabitans maris TaxID=3071409 RepID=A0ABU0ZDZ0_9ACTN|nr:carbohydrate ABC transporter permease [Phytohabitans sp. ZYX-F-186]MDQ7904641.1 carbohydrate ABC transporter permease [Phytohabitans sp. ZYX-F-186]